jgi:hypothetical protein
MDRPFTVLFGLLIFCFFMYLYRGLFYELFFKGKPIKFFDYELRNAVSIYQNKHEIKDELFTDTIIGIILAQRFG